MNSFGKIADNKNHQARVGFVIYYPFQFFVYKSVYKHLADRAEFIIDLGAFFPNRQPDGLTEDIIDILQKHGASFRVLRHEDYGADAYLEHFFSQYTVLVSVWKNGCLKLPATRNVKKVHMTYGAGKELTTFGLWKRNFDLILAYGNFDQKFYSLIAHSVIVGNPKFDDWFSNDFDEDLLEGLKKRLVSGRPTVLYLPTHSDLSSVDELADELKRVSSQYNVIAKLHYFTPRESPESAKKLACEEIILLKDDADLITLLHVADAVLSDNSSAIFDAVLADKPIVVTDFHPEEYFDTAHRLFKSYNRGLVGALTYSGSIEQRIKKNGTVCVFKKPSELGNTLDIALRDDPEMQKKRRALCRELFGFLDSDSGKRGAKAIEALLNEAVPHEKPFLFYAIEDYLEKTKRTWLLGMAESGSVKRDGVNEPPVLPARNMKMSVVVIDVDSVSIEDRIFSLHSIFSSVAKTAIETDLFIITNDEGRVQKCIRSITAPMPQMNPHIVKDPVLGLACKNVLNLAAGESICFTTTACVVPEDWLVDFRDMYTKHPDVIAIGGYADKQKRRTIFDEYEYFSLGRTLGVSLERVGYPKTFYEIKNSLLYQNPSGTLRNISYQKNTLAKSAVSWERISDMEMLEAVLRLEAFKQGSVLFQPRCVIDLERINAKMFRQRNMNIGVARYLVAHSYPVFARRYTHPLGELIQEVVTNLFFGYWKFRLTRVIFLAGVFRSIGYYYAAASRWAASLKSQD